MKRFLLPAILLLLAYGFWISSSFKTIVAGIAIFMFGMMLLEEGFKAFSGGVLEQILRKTTETTGKSLLFGLFSTALMQSSSLVSVITISFLSAELITLTAGVGIIFGANLGTTTGAWLVAGFGLKVDIAAYALPMLAFGVILLFQKSISLKGIGSILAGLGFLFLGIHFMKEGFEAFKSTIDLAEYAVSGYSGVLLFAAIGALATVIMQSSHATLVLTITGLAAGQLTYENALALAIGANVSTTITAILGSLGTKADGKRLALAHLIFNGVTGAIAILFIFQLVDLISWVASILSISQDDYTLKLAIFHSLFNLIGVAVMLPLLPRLVKWLQRVIPDIKIEVDQPIYLNPLTATFPGTAAEAVRLESQRILESTIRIISSAIGIKRTDLQGDLDLDEWFKQNKQIHQFDFESMYERHIKSIYSAIVDFISNTQFSRKNDESDQLQMLFDANVLLIQAVKQTSFLQPGLIRYIGGKSTSEQQIYNAIRKEIATALRGLTHVNTTEEGYMDLLQLDTLKLQIGKEHALLQKKISELIRSHHLRGDSGAILFNEAMTAYDIATKLIEASQVVFLHGNSEQEKISHELLLDSAELQQIEKGETIGG